MSNKYILMLNMDQTLILYEKSRNIVHKYKLCSDLMVSNYDDNSSCFFNGIEWLLEDFLFCAYNVNGQVCLFDIAFNLIQLNYQTRDAQKFTTISEYLNPTIFTPSNNSTTTATTTPSTVSSSHNPTFTLNTTILSITTSTHTTLPSHQISSTTINRKVTMHILTLILPQHTALSIHRLIKSTLIT